jgi:hypothetical protein
MTIMMKSGFAKRCNVSKSRVSQWLSEGKIDSKAIVGTGRTAKLEAALALSQLKLRLSTDERYGLNGRSTNLNWLADEDVEGEDDDAAEIEADRQRYVTLLNAKSAIDDLWIYVDSHVQEALRPHPEAAAAYLAVRPRLADAKWRAQGVEPPCR